MLIADEITASLSELIDLCGSETFTWKGAEVTCVANSTRGGTRLDIGGLEDVVSLSLFVLMSNFLTADSTLITVDSELYTADDDRPTPVTGMTLVFRGSTYRILATKVAPQRSHVVLEIGTAHK